MRGLLRKDWYMVKEYGRPYVPLLLLFCLIPGALGGAYVLMLALALPRSTIASDEVRWDRMAVMLPYRTEAIVGGKYLLFGCCILLGTVVSAVCIPSQLAMGRLLRRWGVSVSEMFPMTWWNSVEYALLLGGLSLLIAALAIPLYYRFTARKGALWANIVVIMLLSTVGTMCFNLFYGVPAGWKALFGGLLAVLAAAGLWVSFRLSVRFYRKRQRGAYD